MARHTFLFDGGEFLTTMGAVWFVSYSYFKKVDSTHGNWKNVSTFSNRISVYNRTSQYHKFWLVQIFQMSNINLEKNTIGLSGEEVKRMAKELLKN